MTDVDDTDRAAPPGPLVYLIQAGGEAGPVKIGHAKDPTGRLRELQTASPEPLVLLATLPGGRPVEGQMHKWFASYHLRGEWFRPAAPIWLEFGLAWEPSFGRWPPAAAALAAKLAGMITRRS